MKTSGIETGFAPEVEELLKTVLVGYQSGELEKGISPSWIIDYDNRVEFSLKISPSCSIALKNFDKIYWFQMFNDGGFTLVIRK